MKPTPEETARRKNFEPGILSKDGFLGDDSRHIHDIIEDDLRTLARFGIDRETLANRLQGFIEEGKKSMELPIDTGVFIVKVQWQRGMIPCPFGERGLQHKIIVYVTNKTLGKTICYSQLNVHMIREHGFFEGRGGVFRIEPEELIAFLELKPS